MLPRRSAAQARDENLSDEPSFHRRYSRLDPVLHHHRDHQRTVRGGYGLGTGVPCTSVGRSLDDPCRPSLRTVARSDDAIRRLWPYVSIVLGQLCPCNLSSPDLCRDHRRQWRLRATSAVRDSGSHGDHVAVWAPVWCLPGLDPVAFRRPIKPTVADEPQHTVMKHRRRGTPRHQRGLEPRRDPSPALISGADPVGPSGIDPVTTRRVEP